jgi:hypothetical protein
MIRVTSWVSRLSRDARGDGEAGVRAITLLQERPQFSVVAVWELNRKVFEEMLRVEG